MFSWSSLAFLWSRGCWQSDLWTLCFFWIQRERLEVPSSRHAVFVQVTLSCIAGVGTVHAVATSCAILLRTSKWKELDSLESFLNHAVLTCYRNRQVISSVFGCGGGLHCIRCGTVFEFTTEGGELGPVVLGEEKEERLGRWAVWMEGGPGWPAALPTGALLELLPCRRALEISPSLSEHRRAQLWKCQPRGHRLRCLLAWAAGLRGAPRSQYEPSLGRQLPGCLLRTAMWSLGPVVARAAYFSEEAK